MFNSREYEFADLTVILAGGDIIGLRGVKYMEKIEREPLHAKGRFPHSIQSGNVTYEGEIKILQSELEKLQNAGNGSILGLNVNGLFSFGNPENGDAIRHDRMEGIRFTESAKEFNQGDKFMEITLPFVAVRLKNNV